MLIRAMVSDAAGALRSLAAAPRVTVLAVGTVGLALALAVGVIAVVNAYAIRALPYPAADRLYRIDYAVPGQPQPRDLETLDWAALDQAIEIPISWDLDMFYLLGTGGLAREAGGASYPEPAPGAWVTPGYVRAFGIRPAIGRRFEAQDYLPGSPAVALISHRLWRSRFGGDPDILGRTFRAYVSDRPDEPETFTIVGVLPAGLWHVNQYTEVLAPLKAPSYPYMARLGPGVTAEMAADRITSLVRQSGGSPGDRWRAIVTRLGDSYIAQVRPIFWSAGAGAALMLLIASANAAVLLLVRGRARHKELAVRLALGASDARLARLLGMEGIILGTAATAAGVMLVGAAIGGLAPFIESFLDRRAPGGPGAFALDGTVLLAAAGCGVAVTVLITLAPVLICFKADLAGQLSSAGRGSTEAPGSRRAQSVLIGIEVAASLALLTGAVLMADSMARMLDVEFGIRAESVASTGLGLRQRSYPDAASRAAFYERLVRRLQGVGGSASVALGDWRLLQAPRPRPIETRNPAPAAARATAFTVSDAFFSTLGIAVEDGRPFDARDRLGAGSVAVVSRSLAARLWPGARAVGREITVELDEGLPPVPCLVVGVVNDVRQRHADDDLFDVYLPLAQQPGRFASIYVRAPRSTAWETELRAAVAEIDRDVALGAPQSLDEALQQERARPRFVAWLLAALATFAALLTLVGVHGVIAYATGARRREIAVRMAVGATPRSVTTLFLRDGGAVLGAGLLAGIAGGLALGRVLEGLLYGVGPGEPRVLVAATLALGLSGLLAIWWPARRAARTDPASVLREA